MWALCLMVSSAWAEAEVVIHTGKPKAQDERNPNIPHKVVLPGEEPLAHPKKSHPPQPPKNSTSELPASFFASSARLKPVKRLPNGRVANMQCLKVVGQADMALGDQAFVRQMAIRDALETASFQRNTRIESKQAVSNFQLTQAQSHFTTASRIVGFELLQEGVNIWSPQSKKRCHPCRIQDRNQEDVDHESEESESGVHQAKMPETYQVILKVCLVPEPEKACNSLPVHFYQAPIVVAQPLVVHPDEARDLSDLVMGTQTEIIRRLRDAGYRVVSPLRQGTGVNPTTLVEPNLDPDLLQSLQSETQAQFLLLPVIRTTALIKEVSGLKRFYNLENSPSKRHLEVDYYWVDLYRQKIVDQQRLGFDVEGDVVVGRDKPVGTAAFFATDTGKVYHLLLEQLTAQLQDFLSCQNLVSQIIEKREDGHKGVQFIVPVPQATGVRVGDIFAVYHRQGFAVSYQGRQFGFDMKPAAFVRVVRVMPDFVVTELAGQSQKSQPNTSHQVLPKIAPPLIQVGDWVKAW